MAKTSIRVKLVTYDRESNIHHFQHVLMNIPEEAARIIKEAWTKEGEFCQRENIKSRFLTCNQRADAILFEDNEPVAGMLKMCCEEYDEDMITVFRDKTEEDEY